MISHHVIRTASFLFIFVVTVYLLTVLTTWSFDRVSFYKDKVGLDLKASWSEHIVYNKSLLRNITQLNGKDKSITEGVSQWFESGVQVSSLKSSMLLKDTDDLPTVKPGINTAVQSEKAVTAHLKIEQLVNFNFAEKNGEASKSHSGRFLHGLVFKNPRRSHVGARLSNVVDPFTGDSCNFTQDKSLYDKSHAVFIPGNLLKRFELPEYRPPGQRWIFTTREPFMNIQFLPKYRYAFNHTMTYHNHADIDFSKGGCHKREQPARILPHSVHKKNKMVAWVSSHCNTESKREYFVHRLERFVKVDIYGYCGKLKCPKNGEVCDDKLSAYKFYVALENSLCDQYITEKVFKSFSLDLVPLVAGAGTEYYEAKLPPHSYIDVEKFKSPEDVAEYLKLLDRNNTLYEEYFAWKPHYDCGNIRLHDLSLRVCRYLHKTLNNGPHLRDMDTFRNDSRATCHDSSAATWRGPPFS